MPGPPDKTGKEQDAGKNAGKSGRFAAGKSGNPAGRPAGSRNKASRIVSELLAGEAETLIRRAIELAKSGHAIALKLCLERIVPKSGRTVVIDLPVIEKASDIAHGLQRVIEAAAAGELTLEEAEGFVWLLNAQRAALETEDLAVRIEALEMDSKSSGKRGPGWAAQHDDDWPSKGGGKK